MNIQGIVFDLYGTLYDLGAVAQACENAFPASGEHLARAWRQKQLEYTWLRTLMERFADFDSITEEALAFTCADLKLELDAGTRRRLCDEFLRLPPYSDMPASMRRLKDTGLPLAVLSNASKPGLAQVIGSSGMKWGFDHLISVDEVMVFKPHRKVYLLAEERLSTLRENLLFVSANSWDAAAAKTFGFPVCWINRQQRPFDQLGATPTVEVCSLSEMAEWVLALSLK
jgi:2-haloacid dehalogenase